MVQPVPMPDANHPPPRPLPVATSVTLPFWEAARERRLVFQTCDACAKAQFYPRPFCRHCLSDRLGWSQSEGRGTIYTFTINHRAANPHMADMTPYAVVVIELDEGWRLFSNIITPNMSDIRIGARVVLRWLDCANGISLPQFALESDA